MFRVSLILLVVYFACLILKVGMYLEIIFLTLIITLLSLIILMITIINLFIALKKKKTTNKLFLGIIILLIPIIGFLIDRSQYLVGRKVLSAYSEGVISGADIVFYENRKMKYCSLSLIGEQCFWGEV